METGAITSYIDVAQVALYTFWLFFFGLVFYLRKEDKREGYPLVGETPGNRVVGFPIPPRPKTFLLPGGGVAYAPRTGPEPEFSAVTTNPWFGSALLPVGNPLLAGIGPNASALRADVPDRMWESTELRIVPLRITNYIVDEDGPDPRGMAVVGADGITAGIVSDLWFDRAEDMVRYLEVSLTGGGNVLVPMPLSKVVGDTVNVVSVMASQFADAPLRASPEQVTLREEDKIQAFFASGHMYATPSRSEPII